MRKQVLYPELRPWWGLRPWKRHGLVLLVAGLVYIAVGWSYIWIGETPARLETLAVLLYWLPIEFWGWVWIFAGILAIVSSRWPPKSKTWGYMVLTGLAAGWAAAYVTGILFANSPAGTNMIAALAWGLLSFMWWAVSGLLNPNDARVLVLVDDSPSENSG